MPQPAPARNGPPREPEAPQRDALGRFLQGNTMPGRGNPFAKHSAALRRAFYDAVTPEDMTRLAHKLVAAATDGDWLAAQVLLKWLLGKPPEPIDPWELMIKAVAREAVYLARQEQEAQRTPAAGTPAPADAAEPPDLESLVPPLDLDAYLR